MAALLDPSAPFVRAVLAIVDDGADLEPAIAALVAAERRHGIRILREDAVGSLASVWLPVRTPRPTLRELRALMRSHPSARGLQGEAWDVEFAAFERLRASYYEYGHDDDTPDAPLFAFLSETSLLLGGTDFAGAHWIEYPNGALGSWTQRAWGHCLDHWSRSAVERAKQPRLLRGDQGYVFFTYDLYTAEPRYDAWCAAALAVIREKCERQLDD